MIKKYKSVFCTQIQMIALVGNVVLASLLYYKNLFCDLADKTPAMVVIIGISLCSFVLLLLLSTVLSAFEHAVYKVFNESVSFPRLIMLTWLLVSQFFLANSIIFLFENNVGKAVGFSCCFLLYMLFFVNLITILDASKRASLANITLLFGLGLLPILLILY